MSSDRGREDKELGGDVKVNEGIIKQHPATTLQDLNIRIRDHHSTHGIVIPTRQQREREENQQQQGRTKEIQKR